MKRVTLERKVNEIKELIEQAKLDGIVGVETDSTWESVYEFEAIELLKYKLKITYRKDYRKMVIESYKIDLDDEILVSVLKYNLSWIRKCIRKGYKDFK